MRKLSKRTKAVKRGLAIMLAVLLVIPSLPVQVVWAEEEFGVEKTDGTAIPKEETSQGEGDTISIPDNETTPPGKNVTEIQDATVSPEGEEADTAPEEVTLPADEDGIAKSDEEIAPSEEGDVAIIDDDVMPGADMASESVSENTVSVEENAALTSVIENVEEADNSSLEKMILHVGGDEVVVCLEEKGFADNNGISLYSMQPLEEENLTVDLTEYTPAELTMISAEYILKNGKKGDVKNIVWKTNVYDSDDNYTVSTRGDKLDLSCGSSNGSHTWEMIMGSADQLDTRNIRYSVNINMTASRKWLKAKAFQQDSGGNKTDIGVNEEKSYYSDYSASGRDLWIELEPDQIKGEEPVYLTLAVDNAVFANPRYSNFKIFEGQFTSVVEAEKQNEITAEICGTGYAMTLSNSKWVTMVTYDGNGIATGCLPFYIYVYAENNNNYISYGNLYAKSEIGWESVYETCSNDTTEECVKRTYTLYAEYPAESTYYLKNMYYYQAGNSNSSAVTAAFAGQYQSIAEASAAGAGNIKESLFQNSGDGYAADYSKGVYFTVFVGEDGAEQEVYRFCIIVKAGTRPKRVASDAAYVTFYGLKDAAGGEVDVYQASQADDSYGDQNFYTMLVENTADLTKLAPVFSMMEGMNLYAEDKLQISGESILDFSKGAVQYTASSESKNVSKNYWLQIVPVNSGKRLYINSLNDPEAHTREDNGVIYSTREMLLDSAHGYRHDILVFNTGIQDIENLGVELVSDTVELDEYWTLSGKNKLSSVTTVNKAPGVNHGELSNMAKLRLRKKDGVAEGVNVMGTLTIKSGDEALMVLTLTGVIGAPCITTETIPQGVKFVPYGIMIQNNNKYSRNKVSYQLRNGSLPDGVELMPNGELYGVPIKEGEYTFTVRMSSSLSSFYYNYSEKTYTLTVLDNTDAHVDAATDQGYDLIQRVEGKRLSDGGSQTLVSQGEYAQFKYVFLDGVKLKEGTDYTSEAGSTRITIRNQTLDLSKGRHTIGVEFRTQDESNTLNRAAQNYEIKGNSSGQGSNDSGSSGGGKPGSDSGSKGGADNSSNAGATGGANGAAYSETNDGARSTSNVPGSSQNNQNKRSGAAKRSANAAEMTGEGTPVSYAIQTGDTLWKIAERFYGSGTLWRKIYADNIAVISDPNKIYAGQIIMIYPVQGTAEIGAKGLPDSAGSPDTAGAPEQAGSNYTVENGDTLWKIARKRYGKGWQWRKIYDANREQISDPAQISAGQIIYIPE